MLQFLMGLLFKKKKDIFFLTMTIQKVIKLKLFYFLQLPSLVLADKVQNLNLSAH